MGLTNKERKELLQDLEEQKQMYLNKQFSNNLYYVLLRFFGASWLGEIRVLRELKKDVMDKTPPQKERKK